MLSNDEGRCTFDFSILKNEPFSLADESEIVAKVGALYVDGGISDWSTLGSGGFIPKSSTFMSSSDYKVSAAPGYAQYPVNPRFTNPLTGIKDNG